MKKLYLQYKKLCISKIKGNLTIYMPYLILIQSQQMDLKKGAIIGTSVAAAVILGLFIKNKIEQSQFKPIEKSVVIKILKKIKKENYLILKQIAMVATQIGNQYKSIDPEMIRTYFNSPESPIQIEKSFEDNLQKVCNEVGVNPNDFKSSVDMFVKNQDRDVAHWVKEGQKQFEQSLSGKVPQPKVTIPDFLTKARILQIHKKLALKRYLVQVNIFRKIKDKSQQQLMTDPKLAKEMPNPEEQQIKILEEEGLSVVEDPPKAVFEAALARCRNDPEVMKEYQRVEKEYQKIFNKYRQKMQTKKITEEELCELEDQLIYSNAY